MYILWFIKTDGLVRYWGGDGSVENQCGRKFNIMLNRQNLMFNRYAAEFLFSDMDVWNRSRYIKRQGFYALSLCGNWCVGLSM